MENNKGCIYILTNPSFPKFVKIGYADDVYQRLNQLNRSECIPYAFRLYAYYEVSSRLTDLKLHNMIDRLNPNLRAIEDFNGKKRVREFYAMEAEEAYNILETIAELNGMQQNLHLVKPTKEEVNAEEEAAEITGVSINRHHFKDCIFTSSLTGKTYKGTTSESGVLSIIDLQTNLEVPNNSNPSKKSIIGQAIIDLGGTTDNSETLYQRYRKLTKLIDTHVDLNEKEELVFYIHIKKENINATGIIVENGFKVLKGSGTSSVAKNSLRSDDLKLRKILEDEKIVVDNKFIQDYIFSSPSAAARQIFRSSVSGQLVWKTKQGIELKKINY